MTQAVVIDLREQYIYLETDWCTRYQDPDGKYTEFEFPQGSDTWHWPEGAGHAGGSELGLIQICGDGGYCSQTCVYHRLQS